MTALARAPCVRKKSGEASMASNRATSASAAWIAASMPSSSRCSLKLSLRPFPFGAATGSGAADFGTCGLFDFTAGTGSPAARFFFST